MGKVLMIIAPRNFRDEELFQPKEELEKTGNSVTIASTTTDIATGMLGGTAKPDLTINNVDVDDYDAVVFVGGTGSSVYFKDPRAHEIARTANEKGKLIGAICIAPSTLANAGLLRGKKATSYPSESKRIWKDDSKIPLTKKSQKKFEYNYYYADSYDILRLNFNLIFCRFTVSH